MINSTATRAESNGSNAYLYALISCWLAMVAIALFSTGLLIQKWRRRRPKSIVHAENPFHESPDDDKSSSLFVPTDPWRFPEQKLTILRDRVLGK